MLFKIEIGLITKKHQIMPSSNGRFPHRFSWLDRD